MKEYRTTIDFRSVDRLSAELTELCTARTRNRLAFGWTWPRARQDIPYYVTDANVISSLQDGGHRARSRRPSTRYWSRLVEVKPELEP